MGVAVMNFLLLFMVCFLTYFKIFAASNSEFQSKEYGRMAMIRPWLSANSLWSKATQAQPIVRYHYFEPDNPARRQPSDMNKQNPLLNLLRSNMKTFGPLIKRAWQPNFRSEEKEKKKFEILRFGK